MREAEANMIVQQADRTDGFWRSLVTCAKRDEWRDSLESQEKQSTNIGMIGCVITPPGCLARKRVQALLPTHISDFLCMT